MIRIVTSLLAGCVLLLSSGPIFSASSISWDMEAFEPDMKNIPSLQNGFKLYSNYCLGCHSLKYQRYERTADDLLIPHDLLEEHLIFSDQKKGDLMSTAMDPVKAKAWFGAPPPDLTMVARARDSEWVYNYLKTFYVDESRPFGVNNKVFENVGMPNVLMELQGIQRLNCEAQVLDCRQLIVETGTGLYSQSEFDKAIYDLTNFLHYVGDPSQEQRRSLGVWVLAFLAFLGIFTYLLNREYWKDVH
ncbi:MAG: cytochrome c1 [Candidatus Azotimanducaceae bacterium]